MLSSGWFSVRCVIELFGEEGVTAYEERITLWQAVDLDRAIDAAEREAITYASGLDARYLGLAQAFALADAPGNGAEVFSLIRDSPLGQADYLTTHFDTGTERTRRRG